MCKTRHVNIVPIGTVLDLSANDISLLNAADSFPSHDIRQLSFCLSLLAQADLAPQHICALLKLVQLFSKPACLIV